MAIYRFRVSFEDYDEVIREIEVLSKQTFLDFHNAIHDALEYNPAYSSSFYVSNDLWRKGEEFAYLPTEKKLEKGVLLMENTRLSKYIDDPHQKFYYTYNFDHPFDFHIQLIKILKEEEGKTYPFLFKSVGKAPKPFENTNVLNESNLDSEEDTKNEFDFLNDLAYDNEEEEDVDLLDDENSESDEFSNPTDSDDDF